MDINEFRQAIRDLLDDHYGAIALRIPLTNCGHAYEAYIFCLVLRAVSKAGGMVVPMGINTGRLPNPIIFRSGPGNIFSDDENMFYAHCVINDKEFEAHVCVKYEGRSHASNEIDVSLCDSLECVRSRDNRRLPKASKTLAIFECKFYSRPLTIGEGRSFVGLLDDCGANKPVRPALIASLSDGRVTGAGQAGLLVYLAPPYRPAHFLNVSPVPNHARNREIFETTIEHELRNWARVP